MGDQGSSVDDKPERDTWYCVQCRRKPYYETARLNAILKEAERSAQVEWADIEAGTGQIPTKIDVSKVSRSTQELFPNPSTGISLPHTTPNGVVSVPATRLRLLVDSRPTANQPQAQSPTLTQERRDVTIPTKHIFETENITLQSLNITDKHSSCSGSDKSEAQERQVSIMAPHLESEFASSILDPLS